MNPQVTRVLSALQHGDPAAAQALLPLVYEELRSLAAQRLADERPGQTLQPTSLVHETYMKLSNRAVLRAGDRAHLLAIAARAMRQVLVDDARRRSAAKRGGECECTTFDDRVRLPDVGADDMLALNDALDELEPRQRQIVECRFFGGMEEEEIAESLGVSARTVRRDWVKARAWLYRALYGGTSD